MVSEHALKGMSQEKTHDMFERLYVHVINIYIFSKKIFFYDYTILQKLIYIQRFVKLKNSTANGLHQLRPTKKVSRLCS
jgi:hypothetical protein